MPTFQVSRKLPPEADSVVEISAGKTSGENVAEWKELLVGKKLLELRGEQAWLKFKGQWMAF